MVISAGHSALRACRSCRHRAATRATPAALYSSQQQNGAFPTDNASGNPQTRSENAQTKKEAVKSNESEELGPMARRLQEATEEALFTGGRRGWQAIQDAGFSEELKEKLLSKIADEKFRNDFETVMGEAGLASKDGTPGGSTFGAHQAWQGEEKTEDAVARMLSDANKPLRPELRGNPIDTRLRRTPMLSPGQKVASARDRAAGYTGMGMKDGHGLSDREKEERKKLFQERFHPEGRTGPISISAIESMANERIENAISRGQFKNIRRGKGVGHDSGPANPFVDTTEYLMNRIIQRQDLVPPWIEKQQELVSEANTFRARLRSDWKRHAARMIASKGGSMQEQMRRAELYAEAEKVHNPRQRSSDQIAVSSAVTDDPVMAKHLEQVEALEEVATQALEREMDAAAASTGSASSASRQVGGLPRPFRDPDWEKAEAKYMTLAIERLNSMTRSYNLMAPDLAKKPYFSLSRELDLCFATVAPLLAGEIQARATRAPPSRYGGGGQLGSAGNVMEKFVGKDNVKVHVEASEKAFGLKEWWRDFWKN